MTDHDAVQLLGSIGAVALALLARGRLRKNAPAVRIGVGVAGIFLATFMLFAVLRLLPRSFEGGLAPILDPKLVACSLYGALLVMSLMEIGSGAIRAAKYGLYDRRAGG